MTGASPHINSPDLADGIISLIKIASVKFSSEHFICKVEEVWVAYFLLPQNNFILNIYLLHMVTSPASYSTNQSNKVHPSYGSLSMVTLFLVTVWIVLFLWNRIRLVSMCGSYYQYSEAEHVCYICFLLLSLCWNWWCVHKMHITQYLKLYWKDYKICQTKKSLN